VIKRNSTFGCVSNFLRYDECSSWSPGRQT
jgi:hypothetical protein